MRTIQQRADEIAAAVGEEHMGTSIYLAVRAAAIEHLRDALEIGSAPDLGLIDMDVLARELLVRSDAGIVLLHRFPRDPDGRIAVDSMPNGGTYAHYGRGHPATVAGLCTYGQATIMSKMHAHLRDIEDK